MGKGLRRSRSCSLDLHIFSRLDWLEEASEPLHFLSCQSNSKKQKSDSPGKERAASLFRFLQKRELTEHGRLIVLLNICKCDC